MKVLVACEESQRVCTEFRNLGHEAYSNDVQKCSGEHPEWHILMDARSVLGGGVMRLQNGKKVTIEKWDLIIAHPPCTYLSNVATRQHSIKMTPENAIEGRTLARISAMQFFMECVRANCDKIAVENPVGIMNTAFRKPDQIIEPYQFTDSVDDAENYVTKRTCLWLKNLPQLKVNDLPKPDNAKIFGVLKNGKPKDWEMAHGKHPLKEWSAYQCYEDKIRDSNLRSKTFPGIAKAMATQWGGQA